MDCTSQSDEVALTAAGDDTLPALVMRASARLMEAKDAAEVLEAKKQAELALSFAKLTKAANETHANCLRIIMRAESMMADEIDKAQAAGTIGKGGRPSTKLSGAPDKYRALGISRQRAAEWRSVRNAGPAKIESIIVAVAAEGRAPTKNDILKGIRIGNTGSKAKTRKRKAASADQLSLAKMVLEPDFQLEAEAAARGVEMEHDGRIAPADAEALAAENEQLKLQVVSLENRVSELLGEISQLKHQEYSSRQREKELTEENRSLRGLARTSRGAR